ncbi:MAG: formate/nitrite transporter family protein [Firmicutes bacterium]|nr:formate/nitrite transporter family protein [[Eubacterium] siraeum]MCM1488353.1 formate/nitrite transporter family protein [Bacillota bacterium]
METLKKAVAAGFMIGIGAVIYIRCENKVAGALLFTVGLFTICAFGMNLFTGKIGYIISNKNKPNCLVIWLGNLLGAAVSMALVRIAKPDIQEKAKELMTNKLSLNPLAVIILSFFCGILMYAAVENYRANPHGIGKVTGLFLCVSVFILAGFEHSVADMCYAALALDNIADLPLYLLFLIEATAGNSLGALAVRFATQNKS